MNQGTPGAWEIDTHLLVTLIEQADANTRALMQSLTGHKPKGKPMRIDRPGTRRVEGGWGAVKKFVKGGE